jgi:2-polyprenyl-3-methyl-5-hydroxy-6-metoxy-1,4-benzoquinol methylase
MACNICGNIGEGKTHIAREMMLGLGDEFTYFECAGCGCLQLINVPDDMARYYPDNYYSYSKGHSLGTFVRGQRAAYARNGLNPLGALMSYLYGPDRALESVARLSLSRDASILDVGCGSGGLLLNLKRQGFTNLRGTDPFLPADIETNGVRLLKGDVFEVAGEFDVVMLHHAFEHMSEPELVLKQVAKILSPDGIVILRTPVSDSEAWKHYGVNWHQLDAPRHLIVHSTKSMAIVAEAAGLSISKIVFDSTLLQFVVSEQYARGITQADPRSYTNNPFRSIFSLREIRSFRQRARQLNETRRGDSACFYLRKVQ